MLLRELIFPFSLTPTNSFLEKPGKPWKNLENPGKPWKTLENPGAQKWEMTVGAWSPAQSLK